MQIENYQILQYLQMDAIIKFQLMCSGRVYQNNKSKSFNKSSEYYRMCKMFTNNLLMMNFFLDNFKVYEFINFEKIACFYILLFCFFLVLSFIYRKIPRYVNEKYKQVSILRLEPRESDDPNFILISVKQPVCLLLGSFAKNYLIARRAL